MNLVQTKSLHKIEEDLNNLIQRCNSRDQVVTQFSLYLVGALVRFDLENYDFQPEVTPTEIAARVQISFPYDLMDCHEFVVKKNDGPSTAYNRAMGVV